MSEIHTLYAITHSLYSARARSYLIKNGVPFREMSTGHESFKADILPKGKLPTIPTLLTSQLHKFFREYTFCTVIVVL
jgi:hypothetical protein